MSFSKTTAQMYAREKWVTRRFGWWNLKPGERLQAIEKGMGLQKGEKVKRICVIEVVSCRTEYIQKVDKLECELEGFPNMLPEEFVRMLCKMGGNKYPDSSVNRIEFKYVD